MRDEFAHEGENVGVVGRGGEHQLVVAEGGGDRLRHVAAREIVDADVGATARAQLVGEQQRGLAGVAVNRGIGDNHAVVLRLVGRPFVVQADILPDILVEHGTVERADGFYVERGGLFEQRLHLLAVFADDADVVAASLVRPVLGDVERAELSEGVGREQHALALLVADHDLRPVHHWRGDEVKCVLAERQRRALTDDEAVVGKVAAEELRHHAESLVVGDNGHGGVGFDKARDVGGVVGLHVMYDEVIGLTSGEDAVEVIEPLVGEMRVNGIHDGDFIVEDDVGIIGHAVSDLILSLEQVDVMVIDADVSDIFRQWHRGAPFLL